jgi:23S rRNA (pseudouridine1915-N3)-methyltransferase
MRLLTVSQRQPAWVDAACGEYEKRLPRHWRFEVVPIRPEPRRSGVAADRAMAGEAERLLAAVLPKERPIVLDEGGESWSSQDLAAWIERWQQQGRDVAWIAGGADGLDERIRAAAERSVSLSKLTLPHGLVRVVLVEQLYRAASLLAGHPYHRA